MITVAPLHRSYTARLFQHLLYFEIVVLAGAFALQLCITLSADERAWPISLVALVNLALAGCLALLASVAYVENVILRRLCQVAGVLLLLMPVFNQAIPEGAGDYEDKLMLAAWLLSCGVFTCIVTLDPPPDAIRRLLIAALSLQGVAMLTDLALDDSKGLSAIDHVNDYLYMSAFSVSTSLLVLAVQLLATRLAETRGVIEKLGRSLHRYSYKGTGRIVTIVVNEMGFRFWKVRFPGATYADYYAGTIANRIKRGGSHRTLGANAHFTGSAQDLAGFSKRGVKQFQRLTALGLRPENVCVEVGCGSLRVGQHAIEYLDHGNYVGLDIVDTFYQEGIKLLPDRLLQKHPRLAVISQRTLDEVSALRPDVVYSIAVLKHVPPNEVGDYLEKITSIAVQGAIVFIDFEEGKNGFRTGANNWKYSRDFLAAHAVNCRPHARVSFAAGSSAATTFLVIGLDPEVEAHRECQQENRKFILPADAPYEGTSDDGSDENCEVADEDAFEARSAPFI